MEQRERKFNGHDEDDAMVLLWQWVKENGPELKALIGWKNQIIGAMAVLIALGLINTVINALNVLGR